MMQCGNGKLSLAVVTVGILLTSLSYQPSSLAQGSAQSDSPAVLEGPLLFAAPTAERLGKSMDTAPADAADVETSAASDTHPEGDAKSKDDVDSQTNATESAADEPESPEPTRPPLSPEKRGSL